MQRRKSRKCRKVRNQKLSKNRRQEIWNYNEKSKSYWNRRIWVELKRYSKYIKDQHGQGRNRTERGIKHENAKLRKKQEKTSHERL
jgi:hypothetical protein